MPNGLIPVCETRQLCQWSGSSS